MEIKETLEDILIDLLQKTSLSYSKIEILEEENNNYTINIESNSPSELIGSRGETIQAIQHILKILAWKKLQTEHFNILVDVDNYRKKQEENSLNLAKRKIAYARKTGREQALPPMSAYLRRKIHLYCMGPGFEDIETYSKSEGEARHLVIKLK